MADTLYTSDGKMHVLIGSTTLASLIREYLGDEAVCLLNQQTRSLIDSLDQLIYDAIENSYSRSKLIDSMRELRESINRELN